MTKKRILTILIIVGALSLAMPVLADTTAGGGVLNNPIGGTDTQIEDVVLKVIKYVIGVLGVIALVMVVYGGFQYIFSAGNSDQLKKARDTIIYAIIGMVIVILSLSILRFVTGAFK